MSPIQFDSGNVAADGSLLGNVWVQELGGGGVFGLRPMANFSSM
jgi:hypothetical protein